MSKVIVKNAPANAGHIEAKNRNGVHHPPESQEANTQWRALNGRRLDLLHKNRVSGLDEYETAELARLNEAADDYLDRNFPLPFEKLAEFEAAVDHILKSSCPQSRFSNATTANG
jgi:hypothetical protein